MLRHRSYPNFPQIDYEFQKFLLLKIRAYCYLKGRSFKHPRFQFSTNLSPPSFTRFTFTLRFASVYANIRGQITIIRPRTPPTPIHESSKTSRRDNGLTLPRCGWWSKWTARFFTEPLRRGLIFRVHDAPPNIYIYIFSYIFSSPTHWQFSRRINRASLSPYWTKLVVPEAMLNFEDEVWRGTKVAQSW